MIEDDEEIAQVADELNDTHIKRKRLMLILLPLLIVIGVSATIFFVLKKQSSSQDNYNIVQYNKDNADNVSVFYDLPEIKTSIKGKKDNHELRLGLNLELSSIEDLKIIEILKAKLNDVVLEHTIELNVDELKGSVGLYWFKEELLYRLNLAAAPVKIKSVNFGVFELDGVKGE